MRLLKGVIVAGFCLFFWALSPENRVLSASSALPAWQQPAGQQEKEEMDDEPQTADAKAQQAELERKACGPKDTKFKTSTDKSKHPVPEAPSDKALIFVIRPTKAGHKIQTKLAVDGEWVGVNRGNNYFFFTLEPGEHYFCSQAENRSVLALNVEAGETYFIQQKIRFGFMKARNKLVVVSQAEGEEGLAKCHPSSWTEKGR